DCATRWYWSPGLQLRISKERAPSRDGKRPQSSSFTTVTQVCGRSAFSSICNVIRVEPSGSSTDPGGWMGIEKSNPDAGLGQLGATRIHSKDRRTSRPGI